MLKLGMKYVEYAGLTQIVRRIVGCFVQGYDVSCVLNITSWAIARSKSARWFALRICKHVLRAMKSGLGAQIGLRICILHLELQVS